MGFDTLHETMIKDIVDVMKDGISVTKAISRSSGAGYAGSLTKATRGLIMEFPVLVSKANHIESAAIVAKAYEAKFVTLLHLAFVASNITNTKEGIDYIRNFHTNLKDGFSVDEFIDFMDGFVDLNESRISADSYAKYKAVTEDMKNLCYYFGEDMSECSLESFKIVNQYGQMKVIKEDNNEKSFKLKAYKDYTNNDYSAEDNHEMSKLKQEELQRSLYISKQAITRKKVVNGQLQTVNKPRDQYMADIAVNKADAEYAILQKQLANWDKMNELQRGELAEKIENYKVQTARISKQAEYDENEENRKNIKLGLDIEKHLRDSERHDAELDKMAFDRVKQQQDMITNYIVPSDLKKANELVPTMMVVNFVYQETEQTRPIYQQLVIGVKAKLYEVEPMDVINKLITKHVDSNILLKLVKVSTREISFVKDFLLAIDDAKLDALSRSRKGSTNKLFKVLERRALGSKLRRGLLSKDYFKAISSLVISQEEAEALLKNNIDVHNPSVIRPIMEKLNLISFAIIDESAEAVKFLFDTGDDVYETIPLGKLEKEQKDGMSKKVINLMAKMNR